jgi:predicted AAA+ superfamily ATPase
VDERRQAGDFLLTGSANLLLMGRVADTLAGRAIYLELPPFCPAEWQQRKDALSPLDRLFANDFDFREWPAEAGDWPAWLLRGGFPPALAFARDSDRALWFSAYVQTYLQRRLHFWRDRPGHEVDFILEQSGKLVALEIKAGSVVTSSDAGGIRAFRASLKKNQHLVRGAVLHAGQARPLYKGILALPWGWMVSGA